MNTTSRFRLKIYALLAAMVILTMLISLSLSYFLSYDHQMKQLKIQMLQTVQDKAGHMGEWLGGKIAILDLADQLREKSGQALIDPAVLNAHGVSDVYEGRADGSFRSLTGWTPPAGYDPRVRPWYTSIAEKGRLTISDPYIDLNTGEMTVSLGRPAADGKIAGHILAEDILIQEIIQQISRLNFSDIGFVWILNERGTFVYHPDPQVIHQNLQQVKAQAGVPESSMLKTSGEARYQHQGSWHNAMFWNIPNSEWLLGVTVLDNKVFDNLERLKAVYLSLSLVLTLIFALLSYLMTRILAAPLISIINFVRGVSEGKLDQKLEIRFNRELDSLAFSLNEMSRRLKQNFTQIELQKNELARYNLELENQVEERTQDLKAAYHQLEEAYETTKTMAATDYLTGIANRRSFFEQAGKEVSRSLRESSPMCILEIDLDNFKIINDSYGHAAGDTTLIHVARQMQDCLRATDLLGRLGGEEFAILLPDTPHVDGLRIGQRIIEAVSSAAVIHENQPIHVTISAGLSFREPCVDGIERMLSEADCALYSAKKRGKNQVVSFSTLSAE